MTGMKEGAGEDPFADDPIDDLSGSEAETGGTAGRSVEAADAPAESDTSTEFDAGGGSGFGTESGADHEVGESDATPDIPWVLARSSTKEDRDTVKQFFLREEAERGERELRNEVEELLGKEVQKLDLREAAYLVAQRHPEEIAAELERWGYEYL